jgi:C-terminal processing protease CtpA/Prc
MMVTYREFQENLMKTLTRVIACALALTVSFAIAAKEPLTESEDLNRVSNDNVADTEAKAVDAQDEAKSQSAYERARLAQEEAQRAQDEADRAHARAQMSYEEARESEELKEWHEELLRRSEEANVRFKGALDALKANRSQVYEVSRIAPLIAASQRSVDSLRNDMAVTLRNRAAATTGGFIGIRMGEPLAQGIVIDEVVENSPAEESGLLEGDIVSSIDGIDIRKAKNPTQALTALIQTVEPGSEVELSIVRDKKQLTLPVAVGRREQTSWGSYVLSPGETGVVSIDRGLLSIYNLDRELVLLEFEDELGHYFGVEFGILVVDVPKDSELQIGDLLLRIDDKPVRSISHAERFLRSAKENTEFTVKRRGKTRKIDIASSGLRISDVREM